jgi:hypothetical protein
VTTVCYGQVLSHVEIKGVMFVMPYNAEAVGGAPNSTGYVVPIVLVTADVALEDVMRAAEHVGQTFGLKQILRAAVKAWAASEDYRCNPYVVRTYAEVSG